MLEVLLIKDRPGDMRLNQAKIKAVGLDKRIRMGEVGSGQAAFDYLAQEAPFELVELPDLIFLDLDIPRREGFETLETIKTDKFFRSIPIVVLSASKAKEDMIRAYSLNANSYMKKPKDPDQFIQAIEGIISYWEINQLPNLRV